MKNFICVVVFIFMLYSVVMLMVFSVWCILNMVMKRGREPMIVLEIISFLLFFPLDVLFVVE